MHELDLGRCSTGEGDCDSICTYVAYNPACRDLTATCALVWNLFARALASLKDRFRCEMRAASTYIGRIWSSMPVSDTHEQRQLSLRDCDSSDTACAWVMCDIVRFSGLQIAPLVGSCQRSRGHITCDGAYGVVTPKRALGPTVAVICRTLTVSLLHGTRVRYALDDTMLIRLPFHSDC